MQIIKGKIKGAQKFVIYGPEGIGKSTFASKFPNPVFIDTEGSTKHMDIARTPAPLSWAMLLQQVVYFKDNPALYDTLVIDTADWAEKLCVTHICTTANSSATIKGIEDFGYGKGYTYLEEEFARLLHLLNDVIEVGINVVVTAHAQMRKFEQPNEIGGYDRWELKLQKKVSPLVKEWADAVLFANYQTFVVNVDNQGAQKGKNKAQGGRRIMYTSHHPCWDAKNRHGLESELDFEYSKIAHCIPIIEKGTTNDFVINEINSFVDTSEDKTYWHSLDKKMVYVLKNNEKKLVGDFSIEVSKAEYEELEQHYKNNVMPPPKNEQKVDTKPPESESIINIPKPLLELMTANNVKEDEIRNAVAQRGYFPVKTPISNYPEDFISGVLIGAWPNLLKMIETDRLPFE